MLMIMADPTEPAKTTQSRFGETYDVWEQQFVLQDSADFRRCTDFTVQHRAAGDVVQAGARFPLAVNNLARVENLIDDGKGGRKPVYSLGVSRSVVVPTQAQIDAMGQQGELIVVQAWEDEPFELTRDGRPNGFMQDVTVFDPITKFGLPVSFYAATRSDLMDPSKTFKLDVTNFRRARYGGLELSRGRRGFEDYDMKLSQKAASKVAAE